ncbi:MAG: acyltransferase family protein [Azonexus sp.]
MPPRFPEPIAAHGLPGTSDYRPDIDGLRAVAVLAVLLFHCFPTALPGGFVGVDVFFVISGYLIGRSSFDEIAAGRYSAWAYFGRRARRIFPALIVVLVSVLIAGYWMLMPNEYELLGKHVAGASIFISNWQFWREVGYFNAEASLKPLLHLWSLAVEEQFYLVLPLFFLVAGRRHRRVAWLLGGVAVISLMGVTWRLADHKAWAYFHLFSRGWELLVGVLLAYGESRLRANGQHSFLTAGRWRSICSGLGLTLVLGSAWGFSSATPFPGPSALLPTLGSALVIMGGGATPLNRGLSVRPLVYIGLVSYPLYLWHWPILSMLRIVDGIDLDFETRLAVFLVSFPLASLTFHLVERPLRSSGLGRMRNFPLLLWAALLVVGALGYNVFAKGGLPGRFDGIDTTLQPASPRQTMPPEGFVSDRKAILVGDSHAGMYVDALRSYFYRIRGKELIERFRAGCKPFPNLDRHSPGYTPQGCPRYVNPAIEQAINDPQIDTVVMVTALFDFRDLVYPGIDGEPSAETEHNMHIVDQAMNDTFQRLAASGKKIVVFFTTPFLDFDPIQCQQRPFRLRSQARAECFLDESVYRDQQRWSREKLNDLANRYPTITLFDPSSVLCQAGRCAARVNGKLIYSDSSHLNQLGAETVGERFAF